MINFNNTYYSIILKLNLIIMLVNIYGNKR